MVSAHAVAVPEQSPDHPVNLEPEEAAAVSVTGVPVLNCTEQEGPQLIPAGELVTVPAPDPSLLTVRVWKSGGGGQPTRLTESEEEPVPALLDPN
jgi:hypothetical protein